MKTPLITTTIGNAMNDLLEDAYYSDNGPIAFVRSLGVGMLDVTVAATLAIGAIAVVNGVSNWVKGNSK